MSAQTELAREQTRVNAIARRIEELRRAAVSRGVGSGAGLTEEGLIQRDAFADHLSRRRSALQLVDADQACFGRLDLASGEVHYVATIGVDDDAGETLAVDWRAPAAEPFYRATPSDPLGVRRRRHFRYRQRRLADIDDDVLDTERVGELELVGEAALLAAIEEPRTGRMGTIVSTIQAAQDAIIRAPLSGVLVVEGGPGTGKTVVALHRAAYLLYTHRQRLARTGVLVIGPSERFLHYVAEVVPSLGESAVTLATPADLGPVGASRPRPSGRAATVKGDERMASVLERAVRARERPLRTTVDIPYGRFRLTLTRSASKRLIAAARGANRPHNEVRPEVEQAVLDRLWSVYRRRLARDNTLHGTRIPPDDRGTFDASVRRRPEHRRALGRMWPQLTPEQLLVDLFSSPALLATAARDVLSDDEQQLLRRDRPSAGAAVEWDEADVALLDEASILLGQRPERPRQQRASQALAARLDDALSEAGVVPTCPRCGTGLTLYDRDSRPWVCERPKESSDPCPGEWEWDDVMTADAQLVFETTRARLQAHEDATPGADDGGAAVYGHVIIDEAQELSAMQWRAIGRRCPSRSMTVVGDPHQASTTPISWDEITSVLDARSTTCRLDVNYRTPAEVMEFAVATVAEFGYPVEPPRSVRRAGGAPDVVACGPDDLGATVESWLRHAIELAGTAAVITATEHMAALTEYESEADRVTVLDAVGAKGLEYDAVCIVDPHGVVADAGPGALYVALTRATRQLTVIQVRGR